MRLRWSADDLFWEVAFEVCVSCKERCEVRRETSSLHGRMPAYEKTRLMSWCLVFDVSFGEGRGTGVTGLGLGHMCVRRVCAMYNV